METREGKYSETFHTCNQLMGCSMLSLSVCLQFLRSKHCVNVCASEPENFVLENNVDNPEMMFSLSSLSNQLLHAIRLVLGLDQLYQKLIGRQPILAKAFNLTSLYVDDLISINDPRFKRFFKGFCSEEFLFRRHQSREMLCHTYCLLTEFAFRTVRY